MPSRKAREKGAAVRREIARETAAADVASSEATAANAEQDTIAAASQPLQSFSLSLSAGGSPDARENALRSSVASQLASPASTDKDTAERAKLADAVLEYIRETMPGAGSASVSVSITLFPASVEARA